MRRAAEMHAASTAIPLDVLAYFSDDPLRDVDQIARGLVDFVAAQPQELCETYTYSLPLGFSVVRIMPADPEEGPRWHTYDAGSVPGVPQELLARVIQGKNELLPVYRRRVSRVWLLVTAPLFPLSQTWWVPRDVEEWTFEFEFERVLLLSGQDGKVFDLKRRR